MVELFLVARREAAGAAAILRGGGEFAADAAALVGDVVENGALLPLAHDQVLFALGGRTGAEQALEQEAWIDLGGDGRGGRTPGHVVLIHAGVAAVAVARGAEGVAGDLERFERGDVPHLLRNNLVHGDAGMEICALGFLYAHAGQERAAGAAVVARAIWPGRGGFEGQTAEHLKLGFEGSQRLHRFVEREIAILPGGPPFRWVGAVGELEKREAQRGARGGDGAVGGGLGERRGTQAGQKGFERRQRDGRADAAQKIPAAEAVMPFGGTIAMSGGWHLHGRGVAWVTRGAGLAASGVGLERSRCC